MTLQANVARGFGFRVAYQEPKCMAEFAHSHAKAEEGAECGPVDARPE